MQTTYKIHEANVTSLLEKIEKLNKQARKLGVAEITYKEVGRTDVTNEKSKTVDTYIEVEVIGETPKLNGWKFLARVETVKDDRNMLFVAPNETVPVEYRDSGSQCEHCNVNRYRKHTFVLQHENGEHKQVGSSCLKDFLGHENPHRHASWLEQLENLRLFIEDCEEYDEETTGGGGGYGGYKRQYDLEHYVSMVAEYIHIKGFFVSRTKAYEEGYNATADAVWNELTNHRLKEKDRVIKTISTDSLELAKRSIEWAISLKETNETLSDYHYNLNLTCEVGKVDYSNMGIVASVITAYQYSMELIEKKEKQAKENANSEYFGEVGKRYQIILTVEKVRVFETNYGTSKLHIMKDEKGNCFTWFTTSKWYDENEVIKFRATVKEHREYNGVNQTLLTRCTEVENLTDKVTKAS